MSFNNKNIIPKEHFEILNLDRNKFLSIEDALSITHLSESTSASVLFNKNIKKHRHQYSDSFKVNHKRININNAIIKEKSKSNNNNNKSKFLVNYTFSISETKRFDAYGNPIDKNKKQRVSFIDQIFDINNNNNNNDNKKEINNDNINNNNIKNNINENIIIVNNENNINNNNNKNLVEYDNIESFKLYNKIMSYKYNLKEQIEKKQICCSTCILF